ncbi:hypothetical protein NGK36_04370 [Hafnia alvei]|jgi:uncharacterized membrane protein|uniref:Uncharacterized protein n=2 Tax=Hafnia alvei TaxID=569 RepID=A0A377PM17_HAFAL|nr:hypothetical protein [Hafnia alvei]MDN6437810.1 hypothetical protein [Lactococcus sp.]KFC87072.1 hypothetical protein GHAL_2883 [Hafnia alvei ATCC 13337]KKF38855.1 hypothetical protein PU01_21040 [Hafnia alvei]MBW3477827.1 hypothetical protein [Hafnia alvei]MCV9376190.1 hypothetical protein [Hafnia alvei]
MKVSEETLLESGFSHTDLQKIKSNVENFGGTLDEVIQDLEKKFNVAKWITIIAFVILIFTSVLSTKNNTLSLVFSLIVGLPFIWYLANAKLAFRAWRYKKYASRIERDQ